MHLDFHQTALYEAVNKENIEIVKLILMNKKIDVNLLNVYILFLFLEFLNKHFYEI